MPMQEWLRCIMALFRAYKVPIMTSLSITSRRGYIRYEFLKAEYYLTLNLCTYQPNRLSYHRILTLMAIALLSCTYFSTTLARVLPWVAKKADLTNKEMIYGLEASVFFHIYHLLKVRDYQKSYGTEPNEKLTPLLCALIFHSLQHLG